MIDTACSASTARVELGLSSPAARLIGSILVSWLFAAIMVSHSVLPRLVSPDGRLVHVPAGDGSLAQAHARLALPHGADWGLIELAWRVESGEALSFVLPRIGGQALVLRVSRAAEVPTATLDLDHGRVAGRWAEPVVEQAESGRLRLTHVGAAVFEDLPDSSTPRLLANDATGALELVAFPPSSRDLYDRVRVTELSDTAGRPISARGYHATLTSPWLAGLVVVVSVLLRRPIERAWWRLLPFHAAQRPRDLAVFSFTTALVLCGYALLCRWEQLRDFTTAERMVRRSFAALLLVACWVFVTLRDRAARRFPTLASRRGFRTRWMPVWQIAFVLVALVVGVVGFVGVLLPVSQPDRAALTASNPSGRRIAVYGGSSTRGFPFSNDWPGTYPVRLEALLKFEGWRDFRVWNLGVDGAVLGQIADTMKRDLPVLHPTDVVVNCVVNQAFGSGSSMVEGIRRIVDLAHSAGARLVFVKEPSLESVFGEGRWASMAPLYATLEAEAGATQTLLVDPIPGFRDHREEFLFMDDVHLSPRGHELMAEILFLHFVSGLERSDGR